MTVASQVKTCLSSLKGAQASLEQFALETQNECKNLVHERSRANTTNRNSSREPGNRIGVRRASI